MLKKSLFSLAQPWCAKTHLSPSGVLASFRSSTYPRGYASALYSLRPCWTKFLSTLLMIARSNGRQPIRNEARGLS
jgi:hypothetical protein